MTSTPAWAPSNSPAANVNPRAATILGLAAAALTAVVIATLVAVVVVAKGIGSDGGPGSNDVVMSPANSSVDDPFMPSVVSSRATIAQPTEEKIAATVARLPYFPDRGVRLTSGIQPGLYGATTPPGPCDAAAAATFLQNHSAEGRAWADAIGIQPTLVPYYLNTLTPVTLAADTWVTSHGFTGGRAHSYQTVLQAGTAVMIDTAGVPRMHCESGDPLKPPANRNLADYRQIGKPWATLGTTDNQNVVAVDYTTTSAGVDTSAVDATEFTLIDITTGDPVVRQTGGTINLGPAPQSLPNPVLVNRPPDG